MPEKDRASSIGRQVLLGFAGILAACGLIGFGWWLHPDAESQLPATHAIATIDKPAPMESFAPVKTRAAVQGRAIQTTELSVPRPAQAHPAPHNINPSAPEPTSMPGTADNVPIDTNLAMNLFADKIAQQENRDENGYAPFDVAHARPKLESALPNTDATAVLRAGLDSWLDEFTPEQRSHFTIVAAECRGAYCRILIALNAFRDHVEHDTTVWDFPGGVDLRDLQKSLMSQTWLQPFISSDLAFEEYPVESSDYLLYSIYFKLPPSK